MFYGYFMRATLTRVRIKSPSGPTLVTCALLVLLPALAVLQYRWVGQVGVAERERMQRNVRNAAGQFREAFDSELARAFLTLQVGPATARDGFSEQYSNRYNTWLDTAAHPAIVADIYLIDAEARELRLRRWSPETHTFAIAEWPAILAPWRPAFQHALAEFSAGRPVDGRTVFRGEDSLVVAPLRNLVVPAMPGPRPQTVTPVFGYTVMQLDMAYVRSEMLPELAQRHFMPSDAEGYRVAVTAIAEPGQVLYRSDPSATLDPSRADAAVPLFGRADPMFFLTRGNGRPGGGPAGEARRDGGGAFGPGDGRQDNRSGDGLGRGESDDFGRWRLTVQHQSGSLEAAVAGVRRRNLAISFGVLLLLSISVALLTATSRRAHRLAQQQMEFVAGVSHELRTPLAVIRSAAENLAQGVVSGDRVKRYGQVLEGEARRLGEMVERVLQYAGIESGLGFGMRAPLAPSEFVETAIDSALPLVGPGDVHVQREIAANLPPVLGDVAALRSAVQNLIANAVKYGGHDRWVGVRVEQVRERRRAEVRITVSDHGSGIPPSELPHIFEPFYRGADALERQIHGNGLGLSLVKRIVTAHGGRVSVSTRAGVGSAFTISLPAAEADARPSPVASEMRVGAHS
jgi:signal transduction histidine kinase